MYTRHPLLCPGLYGGCTRCSFTVGCCVYPWFPVTPDPWHPSLTSKPPPPPTLQVQYGDMGLLYEVLVEVRGILEAGLAAADTVKRGEGVAWYLGGGGGGLCSRKKDRAWAWPQQTR